MICACTTFGFDCVFFPGVFLYFRVTGACPVTTDMIMQVNVITTSTILIVHALVLVGAFSFVNNWPAEKSKA